MNEDDSVWKSKDVRGGQIADAVGSALLLPKDMKAWKGGNSTQMIENLKCDSVVVSFVLYPPLYQNNLIFLPFILLIISRLSKEFLKPGIGWWRPNIFSMNLSLRTIDCVKLRRRFPLGFRRSRANTKLPRKGFKRLNANWWRCWLSWNESVNVPAGSRRKLINSGLSWLKPDWCQAMLRMQLRLSMTRVLKRL